MKKEVLVFIFDGYADWESAYICSELNGNGEETDYVVKTLSLDKEPKMSMGGFRVIPDYSINDYPKNFELLLLIGRYAWAENKNEGVKPVVQYAIEHRIPVGAICNAANFMAENGYLDKIKHSGNTLEYMKSQAPHYKGECNFIEKQKRPVVIMLHGGNGRKKKYIERALKYARSGYFVTFMTIKS